MAGRKYCKNTGPGRQGRGKKYPAAVRAEVVMAMIGSNSICAVARKYGVPESTIRSWMAEEAGKPDSVFAKARAEAAREIAARAALGARAQIGSLQQRVAENQRAAEVRAKLHQRLDEDVRARDFALGSCLKSEEEALADATETGLVVYASPGSYDRELDEDARKALVQQLERYDSMTMSDKDAANVAAALLTAAANAAALVIEALRQVDVPHYRGLIVRKTYPQLSELIDKTMQYYRPAFPKARYNASSHVWTFPSGAKIYFGSMFRTQDKYNYQGKAFDFIGVDELTHFTWEEYSYLMSRNRPTGPGTVVYMQARRIREAEQNDPMLKGRVIQGVADPAIFNESQGESIAQMQEKYPYFVTWWPGDHTRIAGKMQLHYRLAFDAEGRPMFQVFDTCRHFIRTIPNFVYDESNVEDIDTTQEDHIYDECRYVLMENPISPRQVRKEVVLQDDPLDMDARRNPIRVMRV